MFLCLFGTNYVIYEKRIGGNILSQNKEGILSCVGYFICYIIGQYIGYHLNHNINNNITLLQLIIRLIIAWFIVGLFGYLANNYVENVSRRLANIAYILYAIGCTIWVLMLFLVSWLFCSNINDSVLLRAINNNQLFVFLLGNILTGVINLSINTFFYRMFNNLQIPMYPFATDKYKREYYTTGDITPFVSYGIIITYMFVICIVVYVFSRKKIKIRIKI